MAHLQSCITVRFFSFYFSIDLDRSTIRMTKSAENIAFFGPEVIYTFMHTE
jgi:hypothetical protein